MLQRSLLCGLLAMAAAGGVRAEDEVVLTSGLILKGSILAEKPDSPYLNVQIDGKTVTILRREIEELRRGESPVAAKEPSDGISESTSLTIKSSARAGASTGAQRRQAPPAKMPARGAATRQVAIDMQDFKNVEANCKLLSSNKDSPDPRVRELAMQTLKMSPSDIVIACLNPRVVADADARAGAAMGLEGFPVTAPGTSQALSAAAITDPAPSVREAATASIKARNDSQAITGMIQHLVASFDESGGVRSASAMNNAVTSLRGLGDKRVYESLLYYVTLEVRTATSDLVALPTRSIDSFSVNSGTNVNTIIPLRFPIQTPEIALNQVKTTVTVPAAPLAALRAVSGQDFGQDWERWNKWVRQQK